MPFFKVPVTAVASVRKVFDVEAHNAEEAAEVARQDALDDKPNEYGWEFNGLLEVDPRYEPEVAKFCAKEVMEDEIEEDEE